MIVVGFLLIVRLSLTDDWLFFSFKLLCAIVLLLSLLIFLSIIWGFSQWVVQYVANWIRTPGVFSWNCVLELYTPLSDKQESKKLIDLRHVTICLHVSHTFGRDRDGEEVDLWHRSLTSRIIWLSKFYRYKWDHKSSFHIREKIIFLAELLSLKVQKIYRHHEVAIAKQE